MNIANPLHFTRGERGPGAGAESFLVQQGGDLAVGVLRGQGPDPGDDPFISDFDLAAGPDGLLLAWAEPGKVRAVDIGATIGPILAFAHLAAAAAHKERKKLAK